MIETALTLRPRLRGDLLITQQETAEGLVLVIKDPTTGRFFRFKPVEGFILQQFDGKRSLEEVKRLAETTFDVSLPSVVMQQFSDKLFRLGLLASEATENSPAALPIQRRIRGNLFYLRFKVFDPDRLLDWMVTKLRFLFTPAFIVLSGTAIVVAAGVTMANWTELTLDIPRLFNVESLALAYFTMLIVIAAHEFAHGLTCKYFGGSVREMGCLLIYLQPAFFCNVSDAWLFPRRSSRLWVTFAGAYFEIFVWALATLTWRVSDPFTVLNYMALVVMTTSGIKTFFNLNPLIKLDGYYLLSDWLEVPNLRQRAFAYLGNLLRRAWVADIATRPSPTPRERRIFWIYGLLAWIYSTWLLTWVLFYVGRALTLHYQAWGFFAFLIIVAGMLQYPLRNMLRAPLAFSSVNQRMRVWAKRLIQLALLAAVIAALFLIRTDLRIGGTFVILPQHNADVRAELEGILQNIYVDEGDAVQKGTPIATLTDRDLRSQLGMVTAEFEEKQARLKLLKAGNRPEEINLARTAVAKADQRLRYATNHLNMDATLFADRLISKREVEDTRELVSVREKELEASQDELKLLLAGSREETIEATTAEVARLQTQQHYLREQLELLKISSPIDGIITTPKLKDKIGQMVKKGDLIAKVHETKTLSVEISVPEKEVAEIALGQKVVLKARAFPQVSFEGQVTAIAPVATEPTDPRSERTVRVTTRLDNSAQLLKPEMTGHAKIYCGERRLFDLVTRRVVRFFKVEFWSWW